MKGLVIISIYFFIASTNGMHPNVGLDIYDIIEKNGFSSEKHPITTKDGYILELIHLLPPPGLFAVNNLTTNELPLNPPKPPILLSHGLIINAHEFVVQTQDKALAFILSRLGYDIWLANYRGTTLSRKHQTLDPDRDAEQFFDFSMHEVGVYDLPAMIDHILDVTGNDKLSVVSHSEGGTSLYALLASKPEYNAKIHIGISLSSPGIMRYTPTPLFRSFAAQEQNIQRLFTRLKIYESLKYSGVFLDLGKLLTDEEVGLRDMLDRILKMTTLISTDYMDIALIPAITTAFPSGGSWKQILHCWQFINTGRFQAFDYHNDTKNLEKYGVKNAPIYDLGKISAKMVLFYSKDDNIMGEEDTLIMANMMQNATAIEVRAPFFGHTDFLFARDVNALVFNELIKQLKN